MNRLVAALVVLLCAGAGPVMAQLKEGRMMRIVTRNLDPNIPKGHWAAEPVVEYRIGTTHMRVQEPPDVPGRIHALIINTEREVWMVNLFDRTYDHKALDGLAILRNPLLQDPEAPFKPIHKDLELGTEYDYLRSRRAVASKATQDGVTYDKLFLDAEGYQIILLSHEGEDRPHRLAIRKGSRMIKHLEYEAYEADLDPDYELFKPPTGLRKIELGGRTIQMPPEDVEEAPSKTPVPESMTDDSKPVIKWSGS